MASMVPYRSVFGVRPSASSLFDLFDDMTDLANSSITSKAFPVDVEDKGDGYEVKAYLTGVAKDDIDVELNEGRLSISVNVEESDENEGELPAEGVHLLQRNARCLSEGRLERGPFR